MDLNLKAGAALLFELRGKKTGSEYILPERTFQIGSDRGNDLVLNDRDVSSFQVKIYFLDGQYHLQNISPLGAAYVNGESFVDTVLKKGDILTIGERMFRYVSPGETLSQEELWGPVGGKLEGAKLKGNALPRNPFVISAVLVVLFVFFVVITKEKEEAPFFIKKKGSRGGVESSRAMDRQEIKILYNRGKDLLSTRRWDEAVLVFEEVRREMPSFMDTETLYQRAIQESGYSDLMSQGKGLLIEQEPAEAKEIIKLISERSYYYREK